MHHSSSDMLGLLPVDTCFPAAWQHLVCLSTPEGPGKSVCSATVKLRGSGSTTSSCLSRDSSDGAQDAKRQLRDFVAPQRRLQDDAQPSARNAT